MRIHLAPDTGVNPSGWGGDPLRRLIESYQRSRPAGFCLDDDAASADVIIYTDTGGGASPLRLLCREKYWRHIHKSFLYTAADSPPLPVVPGVYVNIRAGDFDPAWHAGGSYLQRGQADWMAPLPLASERKHLFSFAGSCETHPIRQRIKDLYQAEGAIVTPHRADVQSAFERGDADAIEDLRNRLVALARESSFVLCPRGVGAASIRLYEVMGMGRCPVIISDEWVAPSGPDWAACSIRVAERDVPHLKSILGPLQHRARDMGERALLEWQRWFSLERQFESVVNACLGIRAQGKTSKLVNHFRKLPLALKPVHARHVARFVKRRLAAAS